NESTSTFDIALGIQAAINKGANPINVSSGGTGDSPILSDLIANAYAQGIIIYAAKGNDGGTDLIYPAAYPGVTAVTALDAYGQPTAYANKANIPAIGAPGTSLIPFGGLTWMVQGTSPATTYPTILTAYYMVQQHLSPLMANQQLWRAPTRFTIPMGSTFGR
ncbi:MAG TPA: S8 family serine peptidase, partial [Rhizomicrobium sp.]|nr:S8 family serine peptidase [Rhizomicrobium sp.]